MSLKLSPETLESYHRNGYIAVADLVSREVVEKLRCRLREYTHGKRPCKSIAIQIEPRVERGEIKVDEPGDGVRKVGNLIQGDDLFRALAFNKNIVGRFGSEWDSRECGFTGLCSE